jgi:hypothetical protein
MPSRWASAPWWTVMVWATCRDRMSSRRSSPWVWSRRHGPSAAGRRRRGRWGQAIDVSEPEEADAMHHRVDRGRHQAAGTQVADVELDVGAFDPDQRVEAVALAPGEPATQLVGVEVVGRCRVAGQERHCRELGRGHGRGLEGQQTCPEFWVGHRCLTRRMNTVALAADAAVFSRPDAKPDEPMAPASGPRPCRIHEQCRVLGFTFRTCQNPGTPTNACGTGTPAYAGSASPNCRHGPRPSTSAPPRPSAAWSTMVSIWAARPGLQPSQLPSRNLWIRGCPGRRRGVSMSVAGPRVRIASAASTRGSGISSSPSATRHSPPPPGIPAPSVRNASGHGSTTLPGTRSGLYMTAAYPRAAPTLTIWRFRHLESS